MWLFAYGAEPTATHHTLETVSFLYLLLLKDLLTTRSRTEKVLVMVRDKVLQFFHA